MIDVKLMRFAQALQTLDIGPGWYLSSVFAPQSARYILRLSNTDGKAFVINVDEKEIFDDLDHVQRTVIAWVTACTKEVPLIRRPKPVIEELADMEAFLLEDGKTRHIEFD